MFHRAVAAPTGQAVASTRSRTPNSRRDALAAEQILSDVLSHRGDRSIHQQDQAEVIDRDRHAGQHPRPAAA
jgi:hypothetical protein